MKKRIGGAFLGLVFALCGGLFFVGCDATTATKDDFADADAVTFASFQNYQLTADNSVSNYVISMNLGLAETEMHYIETTDEETDETEVSFALSVKLLETKYIGGATLPSVTSNFYAKNGCLYINEGVTKAIEEYSSDWYKISSGVYCSYDGYNYNYQYLYSTFSVDIGSILSCFNDANSSSCIVKKIVEEGNTRYQLTYTPTSDDSSATSSYILEIMYDENKKFLEAEFQCSVYSSFYDTTTSSYCTITATEEPIAFPSFTEYRAP